MKLRKHIHFLPLAALLLCLAIGYATAQPPGTPNPYPIPSPTGAEQINVDNTGPYITTVALGQIRDSVGYKTFTQAATNALGTLGNTASHYLYTGATSGTLTLTTPAAPYDGMVIHVFSVAGFTTVTMTANTGQTINNAVTSLSANSDFEYVYNLASLTWFRSA
jgi:hypothetical protein